MSKSKSGILLGGMLIVVMIFSITSCKKSTSPTTNLDQEAISKLVADDSSIFTAELTDPTIPDTSGFPKIVGVDQVWFWWRVINSVTRTLNISIYPEDSTHLYPYAYVTVTSTLAGSLHIIGKDSLNYKIHLVKPLTEQAVKIAYFVKKGANEDPYRGWSLEGVSGVVSHSIPDNSRQIVQVHLISPGKDLLFTEDDITEITLRDSILTFQEGDSVTLTVTTGDASDSVYLHTHKPFSGRWPFRQAFTNNGDGTFTGTWVVCPLDSLCDCTYRHAAIDVIKHASLDTVDGPYDSRIWGVLYRVVP
jgi:hypothetical protein